MADETRPVWERVRGRLEDASTGWGPAWDRWKIVAQKRYQAAKRWWNSPVGKPPEPSAVERLLAEARDKPLDPMIRLRLAQALEKEGRSPAAYPEFRTAAKLFQQAGDPRKARSIYRMLLDQHPGDAKLKKAYQRALKASWNEATVETVPGEAPQDVIPIEPAQDAPTQPRERSTADHLVDIQKNKQEPTPTPVPTLPDSGLTLDRGPGKAVLPPAETPHVGNTIVRRANADRRQSPRVPWPGVEVELITGQSVLRMQLKDLSMSGMQLTGMGDIPPEETLSLRFHVPGRNTVGTGRGTISWQGRAEAPRLRFGIHLRDVDPDTKAWMIQRIADVLGG
jgi:hypothetical protein